MLIFLFAEALSACHYITQCREKIFAVLYKALNSENGELQEAAYECMKKVRIKMLNVVIIVNLGCALFYFPDKSKKLEKKKEQLLHYPKGDREYMVTLGVLAFS